MAGRGISRLSRVWALPFLLAAPVPGAPEQRVVVLPRAEASPSDARAALPRPPPDDPTEPTLAEVMAAAARVAAGTAEDDESRLSRARLAHWAPQLRAQAGRAQSEAARAGLQSGAQLHWDQQGQVDTWQVAATWDLAQVIYDRDEGQLALSRANLARRRHEVSLEAADRYLERQRLVNAAGAGPRDLAAALLLLRCTAALDALTGGLFADALARAQALAVPTQQLSGPSAGRNPGQRKGPLTNPEQSR